MTKDELGDTAWLDLENIDKDGAKSRYYMENTSKFKGFIDGIISVAFWHTDASTAPSQFYYLDGDVAWVDGLECTGNSDPAPVGVYLGNDTPWGTVYECENGPSLTDELQTRHDDKTVPPPTIIMTSSDSADVFLIVEESSSYPSFMYSIWTVGSVDGNATELVHEFHIAATMRLAEAVVTGIVHDEISGGGCFGLLRKFSESRAPYGSVALRASPFGEHPAGDSVSIEQLENVEVGLEISVDALLCFVWLMLLTSIGITWSFCLRSSIGMDVYDRDELIRAVSISGATADGASPTEMRIFVRKEDTGDMRVVINDTGDAKSGCARVLRRGGAVVEDADPAPTVSAASPCNDGFGGAVVPMGSRTVVLEGVRMRQSRNLPGPSGNFRYPTSISLTASPLPSNAGSASVTPSSCPSPPVLMARRGGGGGGGRGASVLFDSVYSPGDSDDGETHVTQVVCTRAGDGDGTSGALRSAFAGDRGVSALSEGVRPSGIGMPRWLDRGRGQKKVVCSPGGSTTDVNKGPSPLPQLILTRDLTLGPPQLGPLTHGREKETKQSATNNSPEDTC